MRAVLKARLPKAVLRLSGRRPTRPAADVSEFTRSVSIEAVRELHDKPLPTYLIVVADFHYNKAAREIKKVVMNMSGSAEVYPASSLESVSVQGRFSKHGVDVKELMPNVLYRLHPSAAKYVKAHEFHRVLAEESSSKLTVLCLNAGAKAIVISRKIHDLVMNNAEFLARTGQSIPGAGAGAGAGELSSEVSHQDTRTNSASDRVTIARSAPAFQPHVGEWKADWELKDHFVTGLERSVEMVLQATDPKRHGEFKDLTLNMSFEATCKDVVKVNNAIYNVVGFGVSLEEQHERQFDMTFEVSFFSQEELACAKEFESEVAMARGNLSMRVTELARYRAALMADGHKFREEMYFWVQTDPSVTELVNQRDIAKCASELGSLDQAWQQYLDMQHANGELHIPMCLYGPSESDLYNASDRTKNLAARLCFSLHMYLTSTLESYMKRGFGIWKDWLTRTGECMFLTSAQVEFHSPTTKWNLRNPPSEPSEPSEPGAPPVETKRTIFSIAYGAKTAEDAKDEFGILCLVIDVARVIDAKGWDESSEPDSAAKLDEFDEDMTTLYMGKLDDSRMGHLSRYPPVFVYFVGEELASGAVKSAVKWFKARYTVHGDYVPLLSPCEDGCTPSQREEFDGFAIAALQCVSDSLALIGSHEMEAWSALKVLELKAAQVKVNKRHLELPRPYVPAVCRAGDHSGSGEGGDHGGESGGGA